MRQEFITGKVYKTACDVAVFSESDFEISNIQISFLTTKKMSRQMTECAVISKCEELGYQVLKIKNIYNPEIKTYGMPLADFLKYSTEQ